MTAITDPGVYDMPPEAYHADPCPAPSLSASGARQIVDECPARYWWARNNPPEPKRHFDFGHVVHRLLVGQGSEVVEIDAADYRTKAAKEARDAAHDAGHTPILTAEMDKARAMVAALRTHEFAGAAFADGKAEQTLVWRDQRFGVWCRAMLDWLPASGAVFADYKTTRCAEPELLRRAMSDHGYHQRAAWYLDGIAALGLHEAPTYLLVFQEKEPPYEVVAAIPDTDAIDWGRVQNDKARATFARCLRAGEWPGYVDSVISLALPGYADHQLQARSDMGAFEITAEWQQPLDAA